MNNSNNSTDIDVLNGLIQTTQDSVEGYRDAAEDATRGETFRQMAQERAEVVDTLQGSVRQMGGEPETDGSALASAHRSFMGLKDAITGTSDEAVYNEVERGEEHLKEKYEDALKNDDLSPQARQVVQQCYDSVQKGYQRARQLSAQVS